MTRAMRMMEEQVKLRDEIVYVLDARSPFACINKKLNGLFGNRPIVYLLNKSDLVEPQELKRVIAEGVNEEDFERIKKKHYGNFIMNFNDIDSISNSLIGSHFNGEGLFDQLQVLESVTIEDVNNRIRSAINIEHSSMSVIKAK
jgi:ribosome biogenesis GTPase A